MPIYDKIGLGYNDTRIADPVIAEKILSLLQPTTQGTYIDIGCGTGNYTNYLRKQGYDFCGIDPSDTMLETARAKYPDCNFIKGYAERLPYEDSQFDGVIALFTLHHWSNKQQGISEIYRILKPGSSVLFLSFTAEQMDGYWLAHYFPQMIKDSGKMIPTEDAMRAMFTIAGFNTISTEEYFVHDSLQDHFLYANKHHPERYLDPDIRKGISSFSAIANEDEIAQGLHLLEQDIATGRINEVMGMYANNLGDYLFYVAGKE
jgi:SAM-dependent methyltransferase